jgi:phage terminase large subunit GpA-like protein
MKPFPISPESSVALSDAIRRGLSVFTPRPPLTLSEWADRYAYIPAGSAEPGKFVTAVAEYQREPMDAISDPRIRKVVLTWASQTGKSQIQINGIGYYSHYHPAYQLMIQPTLDRAEEFSKIRIAPFIRDTPVLRELYPDPKARDSGNTLLLKEFTGGYLALIGANAPSGLASKPVRVLWPDEVDRFPESAGTEGDSLDLAYIRGSTFWNFKVCETSTPLIKGASRIVQSFDDSDKRYFFVKCPHCGLEQRLNWSNLRWETEDLGENKVRVTRVWYECASGSLTHVGVSPSGNLTDVGVSPMMGCEIAESSKYEMIRRGRWKATARSVDGKTAGFHLNALYSPWVEWTGLAQEWIAAQNDPEKLQVFVNTRLAEAWELRGDGAEESVLVQRQEPLATDNTLPAGVLLLTMGVDVQRDRVEASIWGWGLDNEAWIIDHRIMRNEPSLPEKHPDSPWRELDDYRQSLFPHPSGKSLGVQCVCVDSGDQTKVVYDYTRRRERQRVYSVKGVAGMGRPLVNNGTRPDKNKTLLYMVGVDTAKDRIYTSLKLEKPGPGYTHILKTDALGSGYLAQLTSEHRIATKHRGRVVFNYALREGRRNEALDCGVYATAAREILRPNFPAIYKKLFGAAPPVITPAAAQPASAATPPEPAKAPAPITAAAADPVEDPFAHLPKVGRQEKQPTAPENWRNSWKIL